MHRLFSHHLRLLSVSVTGDVPVSISCSGSEEFNSRSQVLGSSVQTPEGQSFASSAAHSPAQLAPLPQVAVWGELSLRQQVTLLVWLAWVKTKSKKSAESEVVLADTEVQDTVSVESPAQASAEGPLQLRCRNFLPHEQDKSQSDHSPQTDHAETPKMRQDEN